MLSPVTHREDCLRLATVMDVLPQETCVPFTVRKVIGTFDLRIWHENRPS
jgi:hypothetical protein